MRCAIWMLAGFVATILSPLLYLLSLGPMAALASRGKLSIEVFQVYVVPASLIPEGSFPAQALESYTQLWVPSDLGSDMGAPPEAYEP
jgi:hypothetical protein